MRRVRVAPVVVAGGVALVVDQALPAQLELVGRGEGLNRLEQNIEVITKCGAPKEWVTLQNLDKCLTLV